MLCGIALSRKKPGKTRNKTCGSCHGEESRPKIAVGIGSVTGHSSNVYSRRDVTEKENCATVANDARQSCSDRITSSRDEQVSLTKGKIVYKFKIKIKCVYVKAVQYVLFI